MNLTQVNEHLDCQVQSLIANGGLPGGKKGTAYLQGQVQTQWLLNHGWQTNTPGFWHNTTHPKHFICTDDRKLQLLWDCGNDDFGLVQTDKLPHPVKGE